MSGDSKHTPGPWWIEGRHVVAHKGVVVRPSAVYDDQEYDLKLVSAAPDLLDACQRFSELYGNLWDTVDPEGGGWLSAESVKLYDEVHELMSKAIAKATGGEA